ncbi:MAG: hypothetical protein GY827_08000 [Cytophagales bacterium]|nr:hypothetical protein [Cytophagales bacterium]
MNPLEIYSKTTNTELFWLVCEEDLVIEAFETREEAETFVRDLGEVGEQMSIVVELFDETEGFPIEDEDIQNYLLPEFKEEA